MENMTTTPLLTTMTADNVSMETENVTTVAGASRDEALAKAEIAVLSLILYMALFGNIVVIAVLLYRRRKLSRMQLFIIHLAVSDLAVGFFQVLPQLIMDITFRFDGNDFLCKLVKYLQVLTMYGSSYVLIMTALDRYMSICHPLTSQTWTSRRVHVMVSVAWTLSALFASPQLFIFSYKERKPGGQLYCLDNFDFKNGLWKFQLYVTWIFLAVYAIPFIILTICYGRICYVVWVSVNSRESTRKPKTTLQLMKRDPHHRENGASHCASRTPRAHSRRLSRSKVKTVKLTLTVILCFLICWAPWFVVNMWSAFDMDAPYDTSQFFTIAALLASLNSCTNPWIYLAFSGRGCQRPRAVSKTWSSTANTNLDQSEMRTRTIVTESRAHTSRLCPGETIATDEV